MARFRVSCDRDNPVSTCVYIPPSSSGASIPTEPAAPPQGGPEPLKVCGHLVVDGPEPLRACGPLPCGGSNELSGPIRSTLLAREETFRREMAG
jgi:hypothetical protein